MFGYGEWGTELARHPFTRLAICGKDS